jgi:hypothetical protein
MPVLMRCCVGWLMVSPALGTGLASAAREIKA